MAKKKRNKKRRIIIFSIVALVIVVSIVVVIIRKSRIQPVEVQTEKVQRQEIIHKVTASGTIQPEVQVDISANISALIMEITVEEGDSVRAGQRLISLDRTRYEANVEQARSRLKSARANLIKARAVKERAEKLFAEQLISSQELESATAQYQLAESEVELSEAALKSALDDLSKTTLLAPRAGIVTQIKKEVGEMALGSMFQADVLMTIADLSKMEVVVEVNENDIIDVSVGDTAEVEIDAFSTGYFGQDTLFKGIVKEIAHVAKISAMGTQEQVTNFNVRIGMLEIPDGVRQGMSATANIITDVKKDVLAIPIQALTVRSPLSQKSGEVSKRPKKKRRSGETSSWNPPGAEKRKEQKLVEVVFVVSDTSSGESGHSKRRRIPKNAKYVLQRPVKVGLSSETHYEVLSGLREGEEIVTGSYKAISRELQHNSLVIKKGGKKKGKRGDD